MNHSMTKPYRWVGEVLFTKSGISAQSGFAHCMHKMNPAFWLSFIVILFILKLKVGSLSFVLRFHPGLCCQFCVTDIHTGLLARSAKPSDVGLTMTLCTPASSGHCDIRISVTSKTLQNLTETCLKAVFLMASVTIKVSSLWSGAMGIVPLTSRNIAILGEVEIEGLITESCDSALPQTFRCQLNRDVRTSNLKQSNKELEVQSFLSDYLVDVKL